MRQQAISFCRKLARAMYIRNHYNEWLPQINSETQEKLTAIREQIETTFNEIEEEAKKFQLECHRVQLLTVSFDNVPITWYTFQLTVPFDFEIEKLLSRVENSVGVTVPNGFELQFQAGFLGKHVTYRTTNNAWKIHISGANHLAVNNTHTISFDIEYVENAHLHSIGFTLGHELLHCVLRVDDKSLEGLDFKFYQSNKKILEKEGLRLMKSVFSKSDDFFRKILDLTDTPVLQSIIKTLDMITLEAHLNLGFPFSPDFMMKGNVTCYLCGLPIEIIMS